MTREEALNALEFLRMSEYDAIYNALRTYILDSIPTPTVEVVKVETSSAGRYYRIMVNGKQVYFHSDKAFAAMFANDLRAALGIGGVE